MSKDYAHKGSGGRQTGGGGMPGWLWLLVGVALGFAGAAGYYISRPAAEGRTAAAPANGKAQGDEKKKIAIPPKEPSRFTFYELLPDYEIVVPKDLLKSKAAPAPDANAPATSTGRYLIQVGAFKERAEAEQQKASLALLGIESRIEKVTIDNDQTWYRVRIGPEQDQRRVENVMARLEENGIKGLVMMVPD